MRLSTSLLLFTASIAIFTSKLSAQAADSGGPILLNSHDQRHVITALSANQTVTFDHLILNQTYNLIVPEDLALGACRPDISTDLPGVQVLGYDANLHELRFKANATTMSFVFIYPCSWNADDPPRHYISLSCESCKKKDLKEYMDAVIEINQGGSAEDLVKDVLIGGNCFDVSGITFTGASGQIGTFSNGLTNIGFNTGIIMATGNVSVAVGPNDADNAGSDVGGATPDGDLQTLTAGALFNKSVIEFDFIPTQSPVTFNYSFASEEYCEYVGSQFNDVFGFFISGPGFPGTTNIATLPVLSTPVSINNVNHLSNSGVYVNNQPVTSGNLCGQTASQAAATNELQFDGFTRKLTAVANVQPCQMYHIKLKIADVGDGIFDSAVFLNAGSFDAGGNASADWAVNGDFDVDVTYESCGIVTLTFDRVGANPNVPLPINFTITGSATPGLDYAPIPASVTIPAGQDKLVLPITIFTDLISEGPETIVLTLLNPCSCLLPQITLTINDLPALTSVPDTTVICGAGLGLVTATPIGGVAPYMYHWSNNSTQETTSYFTNTSTTYRVTITDACGKTTVQNVRIQVNPLPLAQLVGPAPQLCPGQSAQIRINFTGTGPFTLVYSFNTNPQPPIENITDNPYYLTVNEPGAYQIVNVTDAAGCIGNGLGSLFVGLSTLDLTGAVTNVNCPGQTNGAINTTVTGGTGLKTYAWSGPITTSNIPDLTNLPAGTYTVTVTDNSGCTDQQTFNLLAPTPLSPTTVTTGPNCYNPTSGSIDLSVSGGAPAYTYLWSNASVLQDLQGLPTGNYTVTVTDQSGCSKTITAAVVGDFTAPTATAAPPATLSCNTTSVTLDATGSSSGTGFSYNWTASPGGNIMSGGTTLTPVVTKAGTYTLVVTNGANGCTAAVPVQVASAVSYPIANAGANQALTCTLLTATLNGSASSQGTDFAYSWTASNGGMISAGQTTLSPIVGTTGTYTLTVTNNLNGCSSTATVQVTSNTNAPTASIANPAQITCTVSAVPLNGNGSTPAGGISYLWSTSNGNFQSGQTTSTAMVTEPGQYTLVVTNTTNGCTHSATANVTQDNSVPLANATVPGGLDCNTTALTINGAASSTGANFTFVWSSSTGSGFFMGQNTLTPTVNAPGTYTLLITNITNNCTATASVVIGQDNQPPAANAGPPASLTCTTTSLTLGDPAALLAPNLTYAWTTSGTGNITSGADTPTPTVNKPGTYNLVVTNALNGCKSNASVLIGQNTTLPIATVAPGGQLNCTTPVLQLSGNGSSTGAGFVYDWTSSTGGGIVGVNSLTPTVTAAGTYTLLVTNNANGCSAMASTAVTTNADLPKALATPSGILTCAVQSVTLSSAGSSTGNEFSYQWGTTTGQIFGSPTGAQITAVAAGQYTLIVTNTDNNCTATFAVDVAADLALPTADAGVAQTLNCTQLSLVLDGSGSSTGNNYTYAWTAIANGNFVSPTDIPNPQVNQAGTYQLLVTNTTNGCTSTATVNIIADANDPVVAIAAPGILNCSNNSQIVLNGNGSTTGSLISYDWNGPGVVSGDTSLTPTVNKPGNYTLIITNAANGCTSAETIAVPQDILNPPVDAGPDFTLNCNDPQHLIGGPNNPVGPGYSFTWNGGIVSDASSPNPQVDQGGTFNLVVTNLANGCTATDAVLIAEDFVAPQASAGPTFELTCVEKTYTMAATGSTGSNFTYHWGTTGGNFLSPLDILSPIIDGAGQYYLTVTNTLNGCIATSNVQITQAADVPIASAGTAPLLTCTTSSLTLNGSGSTGAEFTYHWTTDANGNIVNGDSTLAPMIDQPGTYLLVVTNTLNNCTSNSSVTVNKDIAAPIIDAGPVPTLTCYTPSVSLDGTVNSNGTFTYQWQAQNGGYIVSGPTTLDPVVNAVGTYNLVVTNTQNGCTSAANVLVQADQAPPVIAIAAPATLTCTVEEVTLNAGGSATGNVTYAWTTTLGHIVGATNTLLPVVDKSGVYALKITDLGNGCTATSSATVGENVTPPTASAGANGLLTCATTTLDLNGNGSSQNGNYFYQWTAAPGGQILLGGNGLTPTVVAGGVYTLVVVNQDNGCTASDDVLVNVNTQLPTVAIAAPAIITCTVPTVTLNGSGSQSGPGISYSWIVNSGNIVSGADTKQAVADASGSYTLVVQNAANGCTNTATVAVTDNILLPNADAGAPATLTCSVLNLTLQGSGSTGSTYAYAWGTSNGNIVSGGNTPAPSIDQAGIYTLTVTNLTTGCKKTDAVEIFQEANIPTDFLFKLTPPSCKDNDGVIAFGTVAGGVGPYVYSIDNGQNYLPDLNFAQIIPGTYNLWIQDVNGCEFHKVLAVPQAPDPAISIDPEFSIELGDSIQLHALLPANYSLSRVESITWTPLEGLHFDGTDLLSLLSPTAKPFKPTEYTVTLVSKDGCNASDRVLIRVDDEPHIYIPNVFSPWDADNTNDKVLIFANQNQVVQVNKFQIFDRWGAKVFEATNFQPNDPDYGWDGRHRNTMMTPAVFVYYAEILLIDGRVVLYKGDVTLLR